MHPGEIKGHIRFDNVSFVYGAREDEPEVEVLHDVSFEAPPNTVTAIVGTTGSGKTTLIDLIPRFYDVTEGAITIDGIDVRDMPLKLLRAQVGFVMQNTFLFNATIQENIAFGRPNASFEEVVAAAKAARAHDFIMEFPEGYNTLVGERGVTLSGGQRQRLAIARAFLTDPRILVLDDSNRQRDSRTGRDPQRAARSDEGPYDPDRRPAAQHRHARRPDPAARARQERGTHDELLALGGRYAALAPANRSGA